jgi:hypothetical protein
MAYQISDLMCLPMEYEELEVVAIFWILNFQVAVEHLRSFVELVGVQMELVCLGGQKLELALGEFEEE